MILALMVKRVLLGWNRPFLDVTAEWLLERRDALPRMLVVVPTSQSGRRLREALAERVGALLSPKFVTPGSFLKLNDSEVAADWIEHLAWLETLEAVEDWEIYQELFPEPPNAEKEWAGGLTADMVKLRRALQENGLTLSSAARILASSVEAERWKSLAALENLVEGKLRSWGYKSRTRALAAGMTMPADIGEIVLAGITEMPPLLERAWLACEKPITALIAAPEDLADTFSHIGRPLPCWTERIMPWPDGDYGAVHLVADGRQQAIAALHAVSHAETPSNDLALGAADTDVGDEIASIFTAEGWPAFHPAAQPILINLTRWFKVWRNWLADPKFAVMMNLLALPETVALVGNRRANLAEQISRLRNEWMVTRPDDLRHRMAHTVYRSEKQRAAADEVLRATELLERWRSDLLKGNFSAIIGRLTSLLDKTYQETTDECAAILNWLAEADPLIRKINRSPEFWIDLMLSEIPAPIPLPPEGRVIDVQGWLELFFEPGKHLVLCGMNEGKIPAHNIGDPWLSETARKCLGLTVNSDRAARDAFLYQAMLEARREGGRVDVVCAKSGSGGDSLLPSRLLLAAKRADLPERVKFLFRGVEPPEAGMRWHSDWKWQPRKLEVVKRFNATSLSSYLACPFRFYLKYAAGMQSTEPDRVEWNARDFGNVAHEVLERWGMDTEARNFTHHKKIHAWHSSELDRVVAEWFGSRVPLAIRVQTEALRQRLAWLAHAQAASREEGWEIIEVEHKFEIPFSDSIVVARVDRIDRHRESGALRVIDYKTGKIETVAKAHRKKIIASTVLPVHLSSDCPAVYSGEDNGKPADFLWLNLQLPLYAAAVEARDNILPVPCYFALGVTEANVAIREWEDFSMNDLTSAKICADWIVSQINAGVFTPPAEKVTYDDFAELTSGKKIDEAFSFEMLER
ncbi:MAG: PD-(D/E)XK nuclease family protein [Gloeobacteraceae cyanobacterium ES-bin-144]|nr:PD-(D/E)XK nuclease family protein [Verrucomicrobiales bacterium]